MSRKLRIHRLSFIIRKSSGFTLIELLIAIGIIGILASLLLSNFIGVRQRARDGVRKSDLRQIQSALELYRSDQGNYPSLGSNPGDFPNTCGNPLRDSSDAITYMQKIPCDPINNGDYVYTYFLNGSSYDLSACLENVNDSQKDSSNGSYCTGGTTNWSYTLQNP